MLWEFAEGTIFWQYYATPMLRRTESCVSVVGLVGWGRAARRGEDARGEERPAYWGGLAQAAAPQGLPEGGGAAGREGVQGEV